MRKIYYLVLFILSSVKSYTVDASKNIYISLNNHLVGCLHNAKEQLYLGDSVSRSVELDETKKNNKFRNMNNVSGAIGYRKFLHDKYPLGIELEVFKNGKIFNNLNIFRHEDEALNYHSTTNVSKKYSLCAAVTYGVVLRHNLLLVAKTGLSFAKFKVNHLLHGYDWYGDASFDESFPAEEITKSAFGFRQSIGLEHIINKKFSILYNIGYEAFKTLKINFQDPFPSNNFPDKNTFKLKTRNLSFGLGLMYKF